MATGALREWSQHDSDVDLDDSGIYLKGKRVPMTARVFVYTVDKTMRPIPLMDEELEQLLPPGSTVWFKKIEPVIDEEYERGRLASAGVADASTSR